MEKFEGLEKALNVETEIVQTKSQVKKIVKNLSSSENIEYDFDQSRNNLYHLMDAATRAAESALEVAQSTDHPRAYEVATNSIKIAAEVTEKIIGLQQKLKDLTEEKPQVASSKTVNNSLFVGSTAELQQFLKQSGALKDD